MARRNNEWEQGGWANRHHAPFKHPHQYYESSRSSAAAVDSKEIELLIFDLADKNKRDIALFKLCSTDKLSPKLGPLLWNSIHTIAIFLEEIVSVYRLLSTPALTLDRSARVCRTLLLLECVASHQVTKHFLVQAEIIAYLHPFLETGSGSELVENLRHYSLRVIASLLREHNQFVTCSVLDVGFNLMPPVRRSMEIGKEPLKKNANHIMPLVLRSMEIGKEPSKKHATFILYRILVYVGNAYVFPIPDRLNCVSCILQKMVIALLENPSKCLYQLAIMCYLRISEDENGVVLLRRSLSPKLLAHETFRPFWEEDKATGVCLRCLLENIQGHSVEGRLL